MAAETRTIVLVHGAWADATGFDPEIRALRDRGYSVIGFGNPLRDLAGDAAYLAEFLRTLTGPIVLVGHSYGGNVISVAAVGNEQVRALVYLNGWMCDVGESQQQLLDQFEGSLVGPSIRPVPFTNPDGSQGTDLYLATEAFHEAFAADVDLDTAAVMAAAQRPYAVAAFAATPSAPPAWNTLPWPVRGDASDRRRLAPELHARPQRADLRVHQADVEVPPTIPRECRSPPITEHLAPPPGRGVPCGPSDQGQGPALCRRSGASVARQTSSGAASRTITDVLLSPPGDREPPSALSALV